MKVFANFLLFEWVAECEWCSISEIVFHLLNLALFRFDCWMFFMYFFSKHVICINHCLRRYCLFFKHINYCIVSVKRCCYRHSSISYCFFFVFNLNFFLKYSVKKIHNKDLKGLSYIFKDQAPILQKLGVTLSWAWRRLRLEEIKLLIYLPYILYIL